LVRAQEVLDSSAQASANPLYDRARFCPWAWFEASDWPNTFALNNSPSYGPETVHKILEKSRSYPEHEAVGTGYRGTSYHWIAWALLSPEDRMLSLAYRLPLANMRVLDVACGYGLGSFHLADIFGEVVGIDYDPETVAAARRQFPRSNLHYHQGNIQDPYSLGRAEEFDFVISLHTLEHVDDDREALSNLYRVLKPRGTMVIEVPIQAKHPLGRPINPHHKREYEAEQITKMITETGLRIKDVWGGCRAIYTPGLGKMRDSILIWTEKA
ncbi:MAG: methyltransferase domain-containing protein, partial [Gammaproteobacteria bacterium]|nr:methyltransferase domain-containing protein [Gammaproteobacteria bacterium]